MIFHVAVIAFLQQAQFQGSTTPPSGDTTGYWQQRVNYQIVATLDESRARLHAEAVLKYTNNSPDTLREMFVHQYLNAFRPGSKWSERDTRENRYRFQDLTDPNYGYERFTQAPVVDRTPVIVDYPGAPDSTVAHFKLPRPLPPHDSITVRFVWDARPSTVLRRQGRRGRTYDFAQWYPKVAVYDRAGWEPNPLIPAGELYGEYGTYDVTLVVRDDQVLAATGVPVSGDPGWARVSRSGPPRLASGAYVVPPGPEVAPPEGYRAVRFFANDVHHFAWSASPDYRYEGTTYVRQVPRTHFPTWDTVSVNVLYKPGDDSTWGGGRAVERTVFALKWLESIWGPYAYPQFTNVHRLESGGTEFPMMIMDGSASQGLILHEAGHNFTYGILGDNEWRSGWLDEGLTDYQTDWALGATPQEQIGKTPVPPLLPEGYRVNAVTMPRPDSIGLDSWRLEIAGRSQPIGTTAADFHEFGIYNEMIYTRAKLMYSQLRDVIGDTAFRAFLHDYYDRWALKHVDERAMRASAEDSYRHSLGWFFDEWVHGTGLMDYAVGPYSSAREGAQWRTTVRVERRGELRHPIAVGVGTISGWTIARADPFLDVQDVVVRTNEQPIAVALDPFHTSWDWDWRNNEPSWTMLTVPAPRFTFNWPYLNQNDRRHSIVALAPAGWYSDPQGVVFGVRAKTNYMSTVDIHDGGLAFASRSPRLPSGERSSPRTRVNVWARAENLYLPRMTRPAMGYGGDVNYVDGLFKADVYKKWDLSPFIFTPGPKISANVYVTFAVPSDTMLLPEQWVESSVSELGGSAAYRTPIDAQGEYSIAKLSLGSGLAASALASRTEHTRGYLRAEGSLGTVRSIVGTASQIRVRLYGGVAKNSPKQRQIFAASQDPFATFRNDLFRPRGALFKQEGLNYLPLGGAGIRGIRYDVALNAVAAVNAEYVQRLASGRGAWGNGTLSLSLFGDAGAVSANYANISNGTLSDAGAGLVARGRLYDRDLYVRFDAPIYVDHAGLAGGKGLGGSGSIARRWMITVGDLW